MLISSSTLSAADRVIVALDRPDLESAMALVNQLPNVRWWKVGLELFVAAGAEAIARLKERDAKVFLDLKLHDIPNTVLGATRSAVGHGADLLTVHAQGGQVMLEAAVEGAAGSSCQLLAITLLTSINSRQLATQLHVPLELPDYVLQLAMTARTAGLAGIVCSPQEVEQLRRVCGPDCWLVTPGIRPTGSAKGDQQRTLTPTEAIAAGSSHLVIGRPITAAGNPAEAFANICANLDGANG
ncbi:MAG: orotidine-5'-phosphate decarboxylase [Cyanobacteria bacterium P01_E01_bin.34]